MGECQARRRQHPSAFDPPVSDALLSGSILHLQLRFAVALVAPRLGGAAHGLQPTHVHDAFASTAQEAARYGQHCQQHHGFRRGFFATALDLSLLGSTLRSGSQVYDRGARASVLERLCWKNAVSGSEGGGALFAIHRTGLVGATTASTRSAPSKESSRLSASTGAAVAGYGRVSRCSGSRDDGSIALSKASSDGAVSMQARVCHSNTSILARFSCTRPLPGGSSVHSHGPGECSPSLGLDAVSGSSNRSDSHSECISGMHLSTASGGIVGSVPKRVGGLHGVSGRVDSDPGAAFPGTNNLESSASCRRGDTNCHAQETSNAGAGATKSSDTGDT